MVYKLPRHGDQLDLVPSSNLFIDQGYFLWGYKLQKINILVLGGYGGAGSSISRLLLQETSCNVLIAGRNEAKAIELSEILNYEFPDRVSGVFADASRPETLAKAFLGIDMLISAATTIEFRDEVARAALHAGIDYLDIHYPQQNIAVLKKMAVQIKADSRCFITQAGFCPGLPSVLIRLAGEHFSRYEKARVGIAMNTRFEKGGAINEFIDSLSNFKAEIYRDGRWKKAGLSDAMKFDFGHHFGKKQCYPMNLEEMCDLPKMTGLGELGIYAAGMNWFVDYLVVPAAFLLGKVNKGFGRGLIASLMIMGLENFSPEEEDVMILLKASGKSEAGPKELTIKIQHSDAYYFTAAPVVACIQQYLQKKIKPGLNIMGHVVDPEAFIKDIQRMGINIEVIEI